MQFRNYGPFELARTPKNSIDLSKEAKLDFIEMIEDLHEGLTWACGCYLFAVKPAGGSRVVPWYVGQANRNDFGNEFMTADKLMKFSHAFERYDKARPWLFLMARHKPGGGFSTPSKSKKGHSDIHNLEGLLIGMAVRQNGELINIQKTKALREIVVPGILNSKIGIGANSVASGHLRRAFGAS